MVKMVFDDFKNTLKISSMNVLLLAKIACELQTCFYHASFSRSQAVVVICDKEPSNDQEDGHLKDHMLTMNTQ